MKRLGGVRPLGLLHVLCRLQCRLRRPLLSAWQKRNFRRCWWSTKGRSAEKCVWIPSAWSEYCTIRGYCSGALLLDLKKAFGYVQHHLWQAAIDTHALPALAASPLDRCLPCAARAGSSRGLQ
eukprot:6601677-Pyramimonas_sp.AAC.1